MSTNTFPVLMLYNPQSAWVHAGLTVMCFYCSSILLAKIHPTSSFLDDICFKKKTLVSLNPGSTIHRFHNLL